MAANTTIAAGVLPSPRRRRRAGRGEARAGLLFATPWMIGLTTFTLIPLILTFVVAQTKFQIIGLPQYIGLQNYETMLKDPAFWTSARNTLTHRELDATMIFVTHDQVEAMTFADRIVVLNGGRIEQTGTPREVYHRPASLFVAGFIGSPAMNLLPVKLHRGASLETAWGARLEWPGAVPALADNNAVTLGLRPERLSLVSQDRAQARGEVTLAEHLGGETILHLSVDSTTSVTVKSAGDVAVHVGDRVHVGFDLTGACLFGADGLRIAPA